MSKANVDLVKQLYEAFRTRDQELILSLISPDIEVRQSDALPWGGVYHGKEGFREFFGKLLGHIHSTLALERFLDAGDRVVAIGRTQGHVLINERPFDVPLAHVWHVRDGLIVSFHPYIDIPTMQASLPAPDGSSK